MRKIAVPFLVLFLVAAAFLSPSVTHASAVTAFCWADDYQIAQGEGTGVYCSGFTPLKWLSFYYVEPDGTAVTGSDLKSDANGNVAFGWGNGAKGGFGFSYSLGTYTLVIQEL